MNFNDTIQSYMPEYPPWPAQVGIGKQITLCGYFPLNPLFVNT